MTIENVKCPDCGGEMVSRKSQYGVFWGCKAYPKCKGTRDNMGRSKEEARREREQEKLKDSGEWFNSDSNTNRGFTFNRKSE